MMRVPESGTIKYKGTGFRYAGGKHGKIEQESLEMFMFKRKILKELEQMDENEDFIMQIGLAGKEKNE